jgi:hypothetical protein
MIHTGKVCIILINYVKLIQYFQSFRECFNNSDKIRTRSILRSNYKLTSLFPLLLPYDGVVWYTMYRYLYKELNI